jgi:hypothetical protein
MLVAFLPRVGQVKNAVVRPNTCANLFVDPHALRRPPLKLEPLRRLVKLAVLSKAARRESLGLVHNLRIPTTCGFRMVVPFIDKGSTTVLDPIAIWSVWTKGHEDYGVIPAQAKVHPLLETGALAATHLNVRDYVVTHGLSHDAEGGVRRWVAGRHYGVRAVVTDCGSRARVLSN